LLHHAEEIVNNLCALQEKAEALAKDTDFSIRIISSSFCPLEHVYTVFEELTDQWPECQPVIDIVSPCSLEAQFRNSKNCLAISTLPTTRELQGTVTTEPVGWIGFSYVAASGHPMLRDLPLDRRVLGRYRQLALTGACESLTKPMSSQIWVFNDLTIVSSLVEQGLGWALLPKQIVSDKIKTGALTAIDCCDVLTEPRLPYGIFWKKTLPLYPVAEFFLRRYLAAASEGAS
jgi:DNA-binding transcriptional LysR family regulator